MLAHMGVETLRISDEMFFLNRKYYLPILENCIANDYQFNMWTYSRVDLRPKVLETFKKLASTGLHLALRQEISKFGRKCPRVLLKR